MGLDQSKVDHSRAGSEMLSAKDMEAQGAEPLCSLDELKEECLKLRSGILDLSETVEDIFDDSGSDVVSVDMEAKLLEMTRGNQAIIQKLTRSLEKHAKVFDQEKNELVMAIVKEVVSSVNNYMNMLIMNIRKLKRLMGESSEVSQRRSRGAPSGRASSELVYDVISDHQDVDAMLLQLLDTLPEREELERDIVRTLVLWKSRTHPTETDYRT